jgi:hypothetical protein
MTYPRKLPISGVTVWACCMSNIGPECQHRTLPDDGKGIKCDLCGMIANLDPGFHAERYDHLPEITVDGVRKRWSFETYAFEPIDPVPGPSVPPSVFLFKERHPGAYVTVAVGLSTQDIREHIVRVLTDTPGVIPGDGPGVSLFGPDGQVWRWTGESSESMHTDPACDGDDVICLACETYASVRQEARELVDVAINETITDVPDYRGHWRGQAYITHHTYGPMVHRDREDAERRNAWERANRPA